MAGSGNAPCGAEPTWWPGDWLTACLEQSLKWFQNLSRLRRPRSQRERGRHSDHTCPAKLSSRDINTGSRLSARVVTGPRCGGAGWQGLAGSARTADEKRGGKWTERGSEGGGGRGRPWRHRNKFSGVRLVKLCAGVISLSAGVVEGHRTADWTVLTSAQFPPRGDVYQPGRGVQIFRSLTTSQVSHCDKWLLSLLM